MTGTRISAGRGFLLISLLAFPVLALADAPGRISFVWGEAYLQGSGDEDWSYAEPNLAVLSGDSFWTDTGALLGLELPHQVHLLQYKRHELG